MNPEDATGRADASGAGRVGLLPAAGYARRLGDLRGSKEAQLVHHAGGESRPAACWALEQMQRAGVERAYVVLREGKWDVLACLGDGSRLGVPLAYVVTPGTESVAHSIDLAHPFVRDASVALAWPDVLYEPEDALARTLARLADSGTDVSLGLFPTKPGDRFDPVSADADGVVRSLGRGRDESALPCSWVLAAWGPAFTAFLHAQLAGRRDTGERERELSLSDLFQAALEAGLTITSLRFDEGRFLDIGIPEDLARARHDSEVRR
jgi:glucose-1-phosphate thymidylyltransferase